MKFFLEAIEIAKREGVIGVENGRLRVFKHLGDFWEDIQQCHPFVFTPTGTTKDLTDLGADDNPTYGVDRRDLDAPFKVFSIEVLGAHVTIPRPTDQERVWIDWIMVKEIQPKEYMYIALCEKRDDELGKTRFLFASNAEGPIVAEFLKRLKTEKIGVEQVREKIKLGTGKEKTFHTIRKIVHVRPARLIDSTYSESRVIDWSHRWAVRGHWRALRGLGKDREGNYCVPGYTWVSEHVRGPEGAPLVVKTRVVDGTNE